MGQFQAITSLARFAAEVVTQQQAVVSPRRQIIFALRRDLRAARVRGQGERLLSPAARRPIPGDPVQRVLAWNDGDDELFARGECHA